MQLTKKDFIQKLYEIEELTDLKLGREVQKVIRSEIIPIDIIKLINTYDKKFLQIYDTYNTIYESRKKNPLYRNLKNGCSNDIETAVALSSLITRILISCTKIENAEERAIFAKAMNLEEIQKAIAKAILEMRFGDLNQKAEEVKELLHILYVDDN